MSKSMKRQKGADNVSASPNGKDRKTSRSRSKSTVVDSNSKNEFHKGRSKRLKTVCRSCSPVKGKSHAKAPVEVINSTTSKQPVKRKIIFNDENNNATVKNKRSTLVDKPNISDGKDVVQAGTSSEETAYERLLRKVNEKKSVVQGKAKSSDKNGPSLSQSLDHCDGVFSEIDDTVDDVCYDDDFGDGINVAIDDPVMVEQDGDRNSSSEEEQGMNPSIDLVNESMDHDRLMVNPRFQNLVDKAVDVRIQKVLNEMAMQNKQTVEKVNGGKAKQRTVIMPKLSVNATLAKTIKSPSDTTIYAPTLAKGNPIVDPQRFSQDGLINNQVSNFVENVRQEMTAQRADRSMVSEPEPLVHQGHIAV